jgi:hypothetical protein
MDGGTGRGWAASHDRDQRNGDTEDADQSTDQGDKGLQARTEGILTAFAAVLADLANRLTADRALNQGGWGRGLSWGVHRQGMDPDSLAIPKEEGSTRIQCRQPGSSGGVKGISSILPPMGLSWTGGAVQAAGLD